MDKQTIRKQIREAKCQFSLEEKQQLSLPILNNIEGHSLFQQAQTVMLYWSMKDEVHTHDFVEKWYQHKRILLPSINGDELVLKQFEGMDELIAGEGFGIPEPAGDPFTAYNEIDLIIVPGIAFDIQNNRLGRGRGFYDKLLKTTNCPKMGICFDFQLLSAIPTEPHDMPMDVVISI
ncbi:5-formyltetrahydrofolate cyclo-ligase [Prolixibacteraceae bacterium JC049]|nr:5-formyltetrahydrofolate cyclo-ligase [Prolixibacteraceae bacterium JC049]